MLFVIAIISLITAAVVINVFGEHRLSIFSITCDWFYSIFDFIKGTHINRCCIIDSVF